MWFIQTSVDALVLPSDNAGRTTLTGSVPAWHHIIRNSQHDAETDGVQLASAALHWSIWPWQQNGSRIHVNDNPAIAPQLLQMVRDEPHRACAFANFRPQGKRQLDASIELGIVVPPDHFTRYESLVRFAMTMPTGMLTLTTRDPLVVSNAQHEITRASLMGPGNNCLLEELELVVSRAKPTKFSKRDLQLDRRAVPKSDATAHLANDFGDEWYLFRAEPTDETEEDKARVF
ncbi:MAG: hypothetical protein ABJC26_06170 [Gemmatimonadaceae bacterium]